MEQNKKGYAVRFIYLDDWSCDGHPEECEHTYFFDNFEEAKREYVRAVLDGNESVDIFTYETVNIPEDIVKEIEERKRIKEEEERKEAEKRDQAIKKREYEEYLRLKEKFENN